MKRMAILSMVAALALGTGSLLAAAPATGATPEVRTTEVRRSEGAAHAEGRGEAEEKPLDPVAENLHLGTFIVTIAIFVCLFAVVSKAAWKPIMNGLKSREHAIRDSIEAAQRAKADADKTTRDLEARMAEAQRQSAQQLQQAKADALKVAETIRTQAEAEAASLKDRTLREIDAAKQQAVSEINAHAAELGTAVARKILQRNVTVEDQQRLVEESLTELAKKN